MELLIPVATKKLMLIEVQGRSGRELIISTSLNEKGKKKSSHTDSSGDRLRVALGGKEFVMF